VHRWHSSSARCPAHHQGNLIKPGDEHRVDHADRLAIIAEEQTIAMTGPIEPFTFVEIEEIASITAEEARVRDAQPV
jgi:uncharacterized protein YciI